MRENSQLSFIDIKIASLIPPDDPLKVLFESIDWAPIRNILRNKYSSENKGFDPICLLKALLLIYLGEASSERDLARKLRFDARACYLCGFSFGDTPSHNTFHYFRKRLGKDTFHQILMNLIAQCLCIIKHKNISLSIDSSHLCAYPSDEDAKWGYKSKDFSFFGYKVHLQVTNTDIPVPVAVEVTPGNEHDGGKLPGLTEQAEKLLQTQSQRIVSVVADAGYDSTDNAGFLLKRDIMPYIAENPRGRKNPIHRGDVTISSDGKLLCPCGMELVYWGRESKRKRFKFRCPLYKSEGQGCLMRQSCYKTSYGPVFYIKEDHEVQDTLKAIRQKKSFKKNYKKRTKIERVFSILKGKYALNNIRFRGIEAVTVHVLLSLCVYVGSVIGGFFS